MGRRAYGILGPLEIRANGVEIAVSGRRRQALLARLLLDANQVVSADRLIDDLWGDDAVDISLNTLQALLSRLRADLAPLDDGDGTVVVTRAPGYLVRTVAGEIDAGRFHHLRDDAVAARERGQIDHAASVLRDALALWRGGALSEFADDPWARTAVVALREARLNAQEELFELELIRGRHAAVVADLERMATEEPVRERLWGLLMLALYRSGRQADALHAYQALRTQLGEELGLEPDPALRRLEHDILAQRSELDWQPPPASATSHIRDTHMPASLRVAAEQPVFVGRDAEFAALEKSWGDVAAGRRQVVFIGGEPGMGKTTLAARFALRAAEAGALVRFGRCEENRGVAYQPIVEALASDVDITHTDDLLARAFARSDASTEDQDAARSALFDAIGRLLADVCSMPTILVIDDLQWATTPTLLLMRHLVTAWPDLPLLIIATYRDTEVTEPVREFFGDTSGLGGIAHLALRGLATDDAATLLSSIAGGRAVVLAQRLRDVAGGNPFCMGEIVRHLVDTRGVADPGAQPDITFEMPAGVRAVLKRRIGRLSAAAQRVVTMVSIAGDGTAASVLRRVPSLADAPIGEALDAALTARLLVESGPAQYSCAHALVRQVAYAELGTARRAELHLEFAQTIEAVPGASEVAVHGLWHHYRAASVLGGCAARARFYALAAARDFARQLAYEDVLETATAAIAIADDAGDDGTMHRADLQLLIAEANLWLNRNDACRVACRGLARVAHTLGAPTLVARAAIMAVSVGQFGSGRDEAVEMLCDEALASLPADHVALRAQVLAAFAEYKCRDLGAGTRAGPMAAEAVELARSTGDTAALGRCLSSRAITLIGTPDMRELHNVADEMLTIGHRIEGGSPGHTYRAVARLALGDAAGYASDADAIVAYGIERGSRSAVSGGMHLQAVAAYLGGRFDDTERLLGEILEHSPGPNQLVSLAIVRMYLRRDQGRLADVTEEFAQLVAHLPISAVRSIGAYIDLAEEHIDGASDVLAELTRDNGAAFDDDTFAPCALAALTEVAVATGDRGRAAVLESRLAPYSGQLVVLGLGVITAGAADRYLGMLAGVRGDHDRAVRLFEAALELEHAADARPLEARTHACYARILDDLDDHAVADLHRDEAARCASAIGMPVPG